MQGRTLKTTLSQNAVLFEVSISITVQNDYKDGKDRGVICFLFLLTVFPSFCFSQLRDGIATSRINCSNFIDYPFIILLPLTFLCEKIPTPPGWETVYESWAILLLRSPWFINSAHCKETSPWSYFYCTIYMINSRSRLCACCVISTKNEIDVKYRCVHFARMEILRNEVRENCKKVYICVYVSLLTIISSSIIWEDIKVLYQFVRITRNAIICEYSETSMAYQWYRFQRNSKTYPRTMLPLSFVSF